MKNRGKINVKLGMVRWNQKEVNKEHSEYRSSGNWLEQTHNLISTFHSFHSFIHSLSNFPHYESFRRIYIVIGRCSFNLFFIVYVPGQRISGKGLFLKKRFQNSSLTGFPLDHIVSRTWSNFAVDILFPGLQGHRKTKELLEYFCS